MSHTPFCYMCYKRSRRVHCNVIKVLPEKKMSFNTMGIAQQHIKFLPRCQDKNAALSLYIKAQELQTRKIILPYNP